MGTGLCILKENAASKNVTSIPIDRRKQIDSFEALFQDAVNVKRKDLNVLDCFPTNPQAEVLVFDLIPASCFLMIYFYDHTARSTWKKNNQGVEYNLFAVDSKYFSARGDYRFWKNR